MKKINTAMKIVKIKDVLSDEIYREAFRNTYDLFANNITKRIFKLVEKLKDDNDIIEFNKLEPPLIVVIKIRLVSAEDIKLNYKTFGVSSRYIYPEENEGVGEIQINVFLVDNFSKNDFVKIYYVIYEVTRHELEHYYKSKNKKHPDKNYISQFDNSDLVVFSEKMKNYMLNPIEIDSYARSIVYVAKKQKIAFGAVIENVLFRAFFNNDENLKNEGYKNKIIIKNIDETREALEKRINEIYPRTIEIWR